MGKKLYVGNLSYDVTDSDLQTMFSARGRASVIPDSLLPLRAKRMKTRDERRDELKRLAASPDGSNKLYLILTQSFIPFEKLPITTLVIDAILDHEYPRKK